jgi:hypothetical protein
VTVSTARTRATAAAASCVGREQVAQVEAVGEDAGEHRQQQDRGGRDGARRAERELGVGQAQDEPALGGRLHPVADAADESGGDERR